MGYDEESIKEVLTEIIRDNDSNSENAEEVKDAMWNICCDTLKYLMKSRRVSPNSKINSLPCTLLVF